MDKVTGAQSWVTLMPSSWHTSLFTSFGLLIFHSFFFLRLHSHPLQYVPTVFQPSSYIYGFCGVPSGVMPWSFATRFFKIDFKLCFSFCLGYAKSLRDHRLPFWWPSKENIVVDFKDCLKAYMHSHTQIIFVNGTFWICRMRNLCNWTWWLSLKYFLKSITVDTAIIVLT